MAKHTRRIQRTRSSKSKRTRTRKQTGGKGGRIKRAVNFYLDGTSSLTSADIPTFIQETFGTYLIKHNITPAEFREIQSRVFNEITKRTVRMNKNIHTPVKALTKLQQLNDVSRLLNMMEPPKQQIFKNFTNSPTNSAKLEAYMNRQRYGVYGETEFNTPPRPVLKLGTPEPSFSTDPTIYGNREILLNEFTTSTSTTDPVKKKKSPLKLAGTHTLTPERIR